MSTRTFSEVDLRPALLQVTPEIAVLGDPHIGRQFKTGVPVHRRGEREAHQFEIFKESLNQFPETTQIHVCMGDLFDAFRMPEEIVLAVANEYQKAAFARPQVTYVILSGNHDRSRDSEKKSAFEVLAAILAPVPNIKIVMDEPLVIGKWAFVPWTPFTDSHEHATKLPDGLDMVFGHWDFIDFGENTHNSVPYQALAGKTSSIVTGHYHKRGIHLVNNAYGLFDVLVTGSMLPYAHGEDIFNDTYMTLPLAEVQALLLDNPDRFRNVCLRVLVDENETPIDGIDCLALTHKRVSSGNTKGIEVKLDEFSLEDVFRKTFKQNDVSKGTTDRLWKKVEARNI